jgi:3-methyl-2-oxobutanoate hydroxymethyltransferase
MPVTPADLAVWKQRRERFVMLTAYDALTARVLDEAGIPLLLVGDSVGNNVLRYHTTYPLTSLHEV